MSRIACFATQGLDSHDGERILTLLRGVGPEPWPFDRTAKTRSGLGLLRKGLRRPPDLVVMEGTGLAGGATVMTLRLLRGVPYVVSSGDAVGPYLATLGPIAGVVGAAYERLLCRFSAGYIGWTPYLAGRALTLGSPRVATAEGWADARAPAGARERTRERLGIPRDAIVFGIVGSLSWNDRLGYCYGLELVEALRRVDRDDLRVLVVGDGTGLERLRERASALGGRAILPGRVPHAEVPEILAALDVASLPQSVDRVGAFRYTIKLPEYLGARLPVVTGQIPLAYDLGSDWLWRLAGDAPWDDRYVGELATLMQRIDRGDIDARRALVPDAEALFSLSRQQERVTAFVADIVDRAAGGS